MKAQTGSAVIGVVARLSEITSMEKRNLLDSVLRVSGKIGQRQVPVTPEVSDMLKQIGNEAAIWVGRAIAPADHARYNSVDVGEQPVVESVVRGDVAAILVFVARTGNPHHVLIAVIPVVLFLILDAYYLALERRSEAPNNRFVHRLHEGTLDRADIYQVRSDGSVPRYFVATLRSFSVWPFYSLVGLTAVFAWLLTFLTDAAAD